MRRKTLNQTRADVQSEHDAIEEWLDNEEVILSDARFHQAIKLRHDTAVEELNHERDRKLEVSRRDFMNSEPNLLHQFFNTHTYKRWSADSYAAHKNIHTRYLAKIAVTGEIIKNLESVVSTAKRRRKELSDWLTKYADYQDGIIGRSELGIRSFSYSAKRIQNAWQAALIAEQNRINTSTPLMNYPISCYLPYGTDTYHFVVDQYDPDFEI